MAPQLTQTAAATTFKLYLSSSHDNICFASSPRGDIAWRLAWPGEKKCCFFFICYSCTTFIEPQGIHTVRINQPPPSLRSGQTLSLSGCTIPTHSSVQIMS